MSVTALVSSIVSFLGPCLPYLVKVGEGAAGEVGKRATGGAWERAKQLWEKLRPGVEAKASAQEAALAVAKEPNDTDLQAALRVQLKALLTNDSALAQELSKLMADVPGGVTVTASGARAIAIGGGVFGSRVSTGDGDMGDEET
jgi:hypothetical protein